MEVNGMKITDVVVYHVKNTGKSKLKAFAKVVLNDQFIIHGIRIYKGVNGAFMTFPQDYNNQNKDGKPYSICHPTTAELRDYINSQVMAEYALTELIHNPVLETETDAIGNNFSDADTGL